MDAQLHHALSAVMYAPLPDTPAEEQARDVQLHASAVHAALDVLEALLARREEEMADER